MAAPNFPLSTTSAPGSPNPGDFSNQPADVSFVVTAMIDRSQGDDDVLAGLSPTPTSPCARGDITLLNGMLKVLIDEGLVDPGAARAPRRGFDELVAHVAGWTVERVAAECGVEPS